MSDLVAKLRRITASGRANHLSKADRLRIADRIEALEAENARLREAERTAWERGRDAAADECDRMNASYNRSAKGYDADDPLHGRIKYAGAAVEVASANIRDLQPPVHPTPEASHD